MVEEQPIPHETNPDRTHCKHCGIELYDKTNQQDCPVRRLRAMAKAVLQGKAGTHVQFVMRYYGKRG